MENANTHETMFSFNKMYYSVKVKVQFTLEQATLSPEEE